MSGEMERDWKKEYYEIFRAAAESGKAYEEIIVRKNAEIVRLQRVEALAQFIVDNRQNFISRPDIKGYAENILNQLAAALKESE